MCLKRSFRLTRVTTFQYHAPYSIEVDDAPRLPRDGTRPPTTTTEIRKDPPGGNTAIAGLSSRSEAPMLAHPVRHEPTRSALIGRRVVG
jgi:hypothetical protein